MSCMARNLSLHFFNRDIFELGGLAPTLEVEHPQYLSIGQVGVRLAWWKIWALSSVLND